MHKIQLSITLNCDKYSFPPYQLTKDAELSFAPFLGLKYKDLGEILEVRWTGERLVCKLPDRHFHTEQQMNEVKRLFESDDWEAHPLF